MTKSKLYCVVLIFYSFCCSLSAQSPDNLLAMIDTESARFGKNQFRNQTTVLKLEEQTFYLSNGAVKLTTYPYQMKLRQWKFQVKSIDTTLPFDDIVSYNLYNRDDYAVENAKISLAVQNQSLAATISYQIKVVEVGIFLISNMNLVLLAKAGDNPSQNPLAVVPIHHNGYYFTINTRFHPKTEKPEVPQGINSSISFNSDVGTGSIKSIDLFAPNKPNAIDDSIQVSMQYVEGGTFLMGDDNLDAFSAPAHQVTLSSYFISSTEIDQETYQKVMGQNPSSTIGNKLPVNKVYWLDAITFCNKLSELHGLDPVYLIDTFKTVVWNKTADGYRLPTEAEWEFAAKGGLKSKAYSFAGSASLEDVAWYAKNSRDLGTIASKQANELGLFDMTGNVAEWCWDLMDSYSNTNQFNPSGSNSGHSRIIRGGAFNQKVVEQLNLSKRQAVMQDSCYDFVGFRIVKNN